MGISKDITDYELIILLQQTDMDAYEFVYDRYAAMLYGLILKSIKEQWLAELILKKSFLEIWKSLAIVKPATCKLFIWMHNITRNIAMEELGKTLQRDKQENYRFQPANASGFGRIMLS